MVKDYIAKHGQLGDCICRFVGWTALFLRRLSGQRATQFTEKTGLQTLVRTRVVEFVSMSTITGAQQ